MRLLSSNHAGLVLAMLSMLVAKPAAFTYDCKKIRADDHTFNLSPLRGPRSVTTTKYHPPEFYNTTYTLDICAPLKHAGKVEENKICPQNTRVCAIEHIWDPNEKEDRVSGVYPIAGDLRPHGGFDMDAKAVRLSTSDSTGDSKREGVRLVLNGGKYPLDSREGTPHKAIIEFICDHEREGTEGEWDPEEKYDPEEGDSSSTERRTKRADDDNDGGDDGDGPSTEERQLKYDNTSLIFESFKLEGSDPAVKTLRLTWYSKHACETAAGEDPGSPGENDGSAESHWGFFTWLVIIVFLGIAAYLIFGSWLNYNRYGARGWDLVPHADTLRDVPYLVSDFARRVLNSVQGGGSRGGYSAV